MNLEMQKVPINHAFLESGDKLLSANVKAQTYFLRPGNVFRIRYMQVVVTL
jgi:hypothetical protein